MITPQGTSSNMTQLINMATRNKLVEKSLSNLQMSIYINQKAGLHTQSLH